MDKGHYQVKNPPSVVKECWFYTGKKSSIHIVLKPAFIEIIVNGVKHQVETKIPQINMDLPSIRKCKE